MIEITEVKSEKTPGDLKREEVAQKLIEKEGGLWTWLTNYNPEGSSSRETIISLDRQLTLSRRRLNPPLYPGRLSPIEADELDKQGTLLSWDGTQPAFDQDGNLIKDMQAIYVQRRAEDYTLQRSYVRARKFLADEEYKDLVTNGKVIYEVKSVESLTGTIPFESGVIGSDNSIHLCIQRPTEDEPGLMYIDNKDYTILLVEDPQAIVKPISSQNLPVFGEPPMSPTRTIYIDNHPGEKLAGKVEIYYSNFPKSESIKHLIPPEPPKAERYPYKST